MRALIAIVIVVFLLGIVGWVQFGSTGGDPSIRVDTGKIQHDTAEIVERTKDAVDNVAEAMDGDNEAEAPTLP